MTRRWPLRRQDQKQAVGLRPAAFSLPAIRCRCCMSLCVFGFAETALVNQAPAKSAPGLGPSGFDPHAFARPGLRAPLATAPGRAVLEAYIARYREIVDGPGRCNSQRPGPVPGSGNQSAVAPMQSSATRSGSNFNRQGQFSISANTLRIWTTPGTIRSPPHAP